MGNNSIFFLFFLSPFPFSSHPSPHSKLPFLQVVKNFNDFIAANKKAGNLEMGKTSNLKEMGEAMRAMPQYQDMKSKYAVHIELVSRCMGIFKEKGLKVSREC